MAATDRLSRRLQADLASQRALPWPWLEGWKFVTCCLLAALVILAMQPATVVLGGPLGTLAALATGLVAGFGLRLLIGRDHAPWELIDPADGISPEHLWQVMTEALARIERTRAARRRIRHKPTQKALKEMADTAYRVVAALKDDPGDVRRSRRFLNVYLEDAAQVAERYAELEAKGVPPQAEVMVKAGEALDHLARAFERQRETNVADDLESLDIELTVIRRMLSESEPQGATQP
ncbi:5-bromo-4-chloroindolyl phosphate hydrolysis family protein [Roseospirillum parvum]|uniref:5-bromo-4-chloroindolyl phosphate hydrolysis protein n=1 Tax=Roseospirillum parvum TaxID=83401 RepID=A0A1G7UYE5_9PROT|nr:5-bromo-4-chloroindolyl phosphate hydrolysis family protein [Roseospirillum parvum]SDG52311.1 5-bromo-4-chloroindolyl phosphate hydrolysis protein [Roseospirillum parvum]